MARGSSWLARPRRTGDSEGVRVDVRGVGNGTGTTSDLRVRTSGSRAIASCFGPRVHQARPRRRGGAPVDAAVVYDGAVL